MKFIVLKEHQYQNKNLKLLILKAAKTYEGEKEQFQLAFKRGDYLRFFGYVQPTFKKIERSFKTRVNKAKKNNNMPPRSSLAYKRWVCLIRFEHNIIKKSEAESYMKKIQAELNNDTKEPISVVIRTVNSYT